MAWIVLAASLTTWLLTSRYLFRRWVRTDYITTNAPSCTHGYLEIHKNEHCNPEIPAPYGAVAALAVTAALFFPVTLFIYGVMARPPLGRKELAEKIAALEEENSQLRRQYPNT
jgi:hypothetical protein